MLVSDFRTLNGAIPPCSSLMPRTAAPVLNATSRMGSLLFPAVSCLYVDPIKWTEPPNGQKRSGRRRKRYCSRNAATISKLWHYRQAVNTQAAFKHKHSRKAHLGLLVI